MSCRVFRAVGRNTSDSWPSSGPLRRLNLKPHKASTEESTPYDEQSAESPRKSIWKAVTGRLGRETFGASESQRILTRVRGLASQPPAPHFPVRFEAGFVLPACCMPRPTPASCELSSAESDLRGLRAQFGCSSGFRIRRFSAKRGRDWIARIFLLCFITISMTTFSMICISIIVVLLCIQQAAGTGSPVLEHLAGRRAQLNPRSFARADHSIMVFGLKV